MIEWSLEPDPQRSRIPQFYAEVGAEPESQLKKIGVGVEPESDF